MTYDEMEVLKGSDLIDRRIELLRRIDDIRQKYLRGADIEAKELIAEERLICLQLSVRFPTS